ncbi:MAG TPA: response regulator [Verrucomicrobiae bacterium]
MIVEDEVLLADLQKLQLERLGYSVKTVPNGRAAMMSLAVEVPDLIIVDIFMEDVDGLETITMVKQAYPHLKIIATSGGHLAVKMDFLPVAKALGADLVLPKPAELDTLLGLIAKLNSTGLGNTPNPNGPRL